MGAQVRILGPIEVELPGGRRADVPRGRTLAFLALLLTRHGAALHVDRIVDELWEQRAPQHARAAVQVLVSRLRAAAGDDLVAYEGGGYAARPAELDADRFQAAARRGREALARGDPAAAAATLRGALELWRGAALADVGDARFAQPEIARLEELRLACLGDRVEADLALGSTAAVAAELDALVREHPLDERLRGLQMTALYHAGRQADALAAYRDARRALVEGLGVEPSPRLRELEAAILRQDLPAPAPAQAAPLPAARRWVTCVFAQTAGPALDPETLQAGLERFHAVAERTCGRHRGRVVELRGDAVVAVFGIPVAREDDAQRAIAAAAELVAAARLPFGLGVRCGTCTGEVLAAGDGHVVGEAIAVAERLGRAADCGEVRLADATWRVVGHGVRASGLPDGSWRLRGIDADAPAIRRRHDRPLVGRERELELLRATFARVASRGAPEILTVLGEPGIGKSRLVAELSGVAGTVLTGHCPARGQGVSLWPLREAVVQACGDRTWEELAADLAIPPAAALRVAAAVGLAEEDAGGSLVWAFGHLLGALARERPLVLVVDDAHRAEPALLDLLTAVLAALEEVPVLLVWVARADEPAGRPAGGTELVLHALSPAASRSLIANLAGADGGEERIVAAAGGNPLFLEQLVAYVGERTAPETLPPALHALLAARLDGLGATERATLALASVTGDRCDPAAVQALATGMTRADVERACDRLAERDLLVAADGGLRFRHTLIRDAAYASLAKSERARLHERHAAWLDARPALPDADAKVGFHLEAAHRLGAEVGDPASAALGERAGRRLAAAAGAAHRRGDLDAEIGLRERASALLGDDGPEGAALLPDLVSALLEAGAAERAEALAERAVAVSRALGLDVVHARAAVEHERLRLSCHPESFDTRRGMAAASAAAATLRDAGDELGHARAVFLMCDLAWLLGDPVASYEHALAMLAHADRTGSDFDAATAVMFVAWCLLEGPWSVAEARARHAALAGAGGPTTAIVLRGGGAVLAALEGRHAEARADMAEARAALAERGLDRLATYLALLDVVVQTLAGDPAAAERAVEDARATAPSASDRWHEAMLNVEAAVALIEQGLDATAAVARVEAVPAPCDLEWVVKRHRVRAGLAARRDDAATAVAEARAAVAAAEGGSLLLATAAAFDDLATALRLAGDPAAAAAAAERAAALHAAKRGAA